MALTAIEDRYYELHPKSAELYERAKLNFPKGVTHEARNMTPFPVHMTHGLASRKWDVDGNEYVEYNTGHGSMILGQANPVIVKAVQDRMALGTHLSASSDLEIRWADLVKQLIPCAEKVRFTSSGTEAVMMAMRMARAYNGRSKIIKFFDHFHGWSDYANAGNLTGMDGIPGEVLDTMISLQPGNIGAVEAAIEANDVAAIIIESPGAHMGGTPIRPDFLPLLQHTLRYLTRFSCIGSECEDDCCHGWRVDIDEATYKKVKAAMLLSSDEARRPLKAGRCLEILLDVAPSHVHFARLSLPSGKVTERLLTEANPIWELPDVAQPGAAEAGAEAVGSSVSSYVLLGVGHILTGWDHLAFVLALLILAGSLGEMARVVTGFTIAHSVTLALAVMGFVHPQAAAVEALIGFSVALVAAENAWAL
ncbi:MAG TPA: aminotransferase class III-fold pyridoxal phosphate-dependent enzyme, partial [Candidatus Handelsmanbacteria bacterium]|nr:aminotransferase class III-fold pyridoxal phosphate-dependent enzyme [Candidatus Handelsmanbacteria bacterium]